MKIRLSKKKFPSWKQRILKKGKFVSLSSIFLSCCIEKKLILFLYSCTFFSEHSEATKKLQEDLLTKQLIIALLQHENKALKEKVSKFETKDTKQR